MVHWHVLFSDSSLEVLLQHLSLQDVDARDNEVCRLTYTSECMKDHEYIWTAEKSTLYEDLIDHYSYAHSLY